MPRPASFRRDSEVSRPGTGLGRGGPYQDDPGPGGPGRGGPGLAAGPGHGGLGPRRSGRRRPGRGRFRRLRARRWFQVVMALLLAFVIWLGWSVGHALTYPGGGTVSERLAEWARDHYLGPLVTFGEWVSYKPPKVGGKPSFALTGPSAGPVSAKHAGHAKAGARCLRGPGGAEAPGGPPAARGRQVAGARHGQGRARHLRHLHAREQRLHVLRGGHRLDEPGPGAFPVAPRGGGSGTWPLEGPARHPAGQAPRAAGHLQRRLQDFHVRGRVLPERCDQRGAHQGRRVGRVLPGRADRHRQLGGFGADDTRRGGRPAEPAPDRRARQDPCLGGLQRRRPPGAPPSVAATTCGGPGSA